MARRGVRGLKRKRQWNPILEIEKKEKKQYPYPKSR
jgi:hypothetical protein